MTSFVFSSRTRFSANTSREAITRIGFICTVVVNYYAIRQDDNIIGICVITDHVSANNYQHSVFSAVRTALQNFDAITLMAVLNIHVGGI